MRRTIGLYDDIDTMLHAMDGVSSIFHVENQEGEVCKIRVDKVR